MQNIKFINIHTYIAIYTSKDFTKFYPYIILQSFFKKKFTCGILVNIQVSRDYTFNDALPESFLNQVST